MNNCIDQYLALVNERPELFKQVDSYPIVTDRDTLIKFTQETGLEVGVVCNNGKYWKVLGDVIDGVNGLYRYMRVVPAQECGGSVVIPIWHNENGETLFGLLCNDRHAPRLESVLEFPRGHLEPGITAKDNAIKELVEELGIDPVNIAGIRYLGASHPDTGLTASLVHFYEIDLTGPRPTGNIGHEGIRSVHWVSEHTLRSWIAEGKLTCGFSQTAYLKYLLHRD